MLYKNFENIEPSSTLKINEISNELSSINAEIVELERSRANINVEYIKKYSFENIENLSKVKSYVKLRVNNLNLDLETPYKLNDIEELSPTVMGFSRWDLVEIDWN